MNDEVVEDADGDELELSAPEGIVDVPNCAGDVVPCRRIGSLTVTALEAADERVGDAESEG